jgi:capsular exopolysaccharide synthesis family protein
MKPLAPYISGQAVERQPPYHLYVAPSGRDEISGIGLAECCQVLMNHYRLISSIVTGSLAITAAVLLMMTPRYVAIAKLLIEPEPPRLMDVSSFLHMMENDRSDDDYVKTQYSLLHDEQLVAQVIQELSLESNPHFASPQGVLGRVVGKLFPGSQTVTAKDRFGVSTAAIDNYLAHLTVAPENGTRLVKVSFDSPDPELAARIVNTHMARYLELDQRVRAESGNAARDFLEKELARIKARVEQAETALNSYRDRTGILSFGENDQESNEVAAARMEELNKLLTAAQDARIKAEAEMQLVRAGQFASLPDVVNNLMIQNMGPDFDRLQAEYAEMAAKYNDTYPPLREMHARLYAAQKRLDQEMAAIAHSTERRYQAALVGEHNLQAQVEKERQRDFARNDASLQDAVLARDVQANRDLYEAVLKRMNEIGVNESAPVSNLELIEGAIPPPLSSLPQKVKSLLIVGLGSVLLGIALAFVLDQFDDRIKSAEELRSYLHLPELAAVPDFARHARQLVGLPTGDALGLLVDAKQLANDMDRPSLTLTALEPYKRLRHALLYSRAGGAPKTILFTSAIAGEGKTVTASATALAFAQTGARTLLIDADLRGPRCHRIFKTPTAPGLSEVLVGRIHPLGAPRRIDTWPEQDYKGLFLIGAGQSVPNPAELLTSLRMFETIQTLSDEFDFTLIDAAPYASASDTAGLARMVEGVVVVVAIGTPKRAIRAVCERFSDAGAKVLGVVLNRINPRDLTLIDLSQTYGHYRNGLCDRHYTDAAAGGEAASSAERGAG